MNRLALALAALVTLSIAVVVWLGISAPPADAPPPTGAPSPMAADPAPRAPLTDAAPDVAEPSPPPLTPATGWTTKLLLRRPGAWAPVADADVEVEIFDARAGDPTRSRARTDERGMIDLAAPRRPAAVRVRAASGEAEWTPADARAAAAAEVIVAPAVSVVVVDAVGRPVAGVSVRLEWRSHGRSPQDVSRGETRGVDGVALLAAPDLHATTRGQLRYPPGEAFAVLALPFARAVGTSVDLARLGTPVRIVMPDTGPVRVRVLDPRQEPFGGGASVTLEMESAPVSNAERAEWVSGQTEGGAVRFPWIGTGLRMRATARPHDPALLGSSTVFEGPARAGDEVVVSLTAGAPRPVLEGTLVDEGGKPLARAHVSVQVAPDPDGAAAGTPFDASGSTDDAGVFRVLCPSDLLRTTPCVVRVHGARFSSGEETLRAGPVRRGAVFDLGRVVRVGDGRVVLVAGTARFEDGAPAAQIPLKVVRQTDRRWESVRDATAASDDSGRFEIRAAPAVEGPLLLAPTWGKAFRHVEPVPFDPGARDVTVRVRHAGGLHGTIRPASSEVRVAVVAAESGARVTLTPDVMGNFGTRSLLPGLYDVSVEILGRTAPAMRADGVTVVAEKDTWDPRLDVALAHLVDECTIAVTDGKGVPVAGATVWTCRDEPAAESAELGPNWEETTTDGSGEARVATFGVTRRVVAAALGFGFAEAAGVRGRVVLALPQPIAREVVVRVADGVVLPVPPRALRVRLRYAGSADRPLAGVEANVDPRNRRLVVDARLGPDRTATFTVVQPGRYTALLVAELSRDGGASSRPVAGAEATHVLVDSTTPQAEIRITASAEAVARAFDDLAR